MIVIVVDESPNVTGITSQNPTCGANNGEITFMFTDNPGRTNIEFSLDGGMTYPHNTSDGVGSFTVSGQAPGTFDLWVRWGNDECPFDLADVTLVDQPGPTVDAGANQTICLGESVNLTASETGGTAPFIFTWDNGLGAGANQVVSPSVTTTYTVTVTDDNGCMDTDQVTVVLNALPTCTASNNGPVCSGDDVTLMAVSYTHLTLPTKA